MRRDSQRIECEIEECEIDGKPAVRATCSRCGHTTESFGNGERSRKRCLALLREECPRGEFNFYIESDDYVRPINEW